MSDPTPFIYWIRRDLRLADHPGLSAAARSGRAVLPVFVLDPETEAIGAAAKWRLGLGIAAFRARLREIGSDLVLRRGAALDVLTALAAETGAGAVHWTRLYDPAAIRRDKGVKSGLRRAGIAAESHPGHVLFEPWTIGTGSGGTPFKVFTPYWRAVQARDVTECVAPVDALRAPERWPNSAALDDWALGAAMRRGAAVVARHVHVGEKAARERLERFLDGPVEAYAKERHRLDLDTTSGLSENLTHGEISVREVWHAAGRALRGRAKQGAVAFRKEIAWREFAWHLLYHTPRLAETSWRADWRRFPWRGDNAEAERWRRGQTGEPLVDAAMREMFVTGRMHNRARMIVASYLTKHLMTDWRVGLRWFAECLIDWDPASNALGWQWVAGCGPDAAPYFRVFNPALQAERFDPERAYRRRFLWGFDGSTAAEAGAWFDAVPARWGLTRDDPEPTPLVGLKEGRARALAAHADFRAASGAAAEGRARAAAAVR